MNIRSGLLLALLAGVAHAADYTIEDGFDRPGPIYESFEQTSEFQDPVLCRDRCESQPQCKSFTFVKPGVEGPKARCKMRDREPAPVESACCISAVRGKPTRPAVPSLTLAWLGRDADEIGKARDAGPDGAPDHHFRLQLRIPADQALASIELRQKGSAPLRWSTADTKAEPLLAELGGRRVQPGEQLRAAADGAKTVVDLYAHDIGQWDVNHTIVAEVNFASGRKVAHDVVIEPPPDQLLGFWETLCPSNNFEPRQFNGRILLVRQPDDTLTGWFDWMRLEGKLDAGGKLEGSAEDAKNHVDFAGALERPVRGKPLKGSGTFKFTQQQDGCTASGSWSSR